MIQTEDKKDFLIRMSQFIFRKESEALARECQCNLIKTVLFTAGNTGLSVQDIIEGIDKQMGLKKFPVHIIENEVKRLSDEGGELREESGKYYLESKEYEEMNKTISERRDTLNHIESVMKAKIMDKLKTKVDACMRF